ncbi:8068_t:CDS:2, partial [Acaulospora morrowiae]
SDTLIQVWNDDKNLKKVADKGYRMIVGSSDYWYLDCGHGAWAGNFVNGNSWCDPYKTWQKIYSYNLTTGLTDKEAKLVIGGEVLLWSEQSDPTNFERMLWPRSSAAAEVLWSGVNKSSVVEALPRLHDWRFRMVKRGIQAEPLQPLWCVKHGGCDLPH